MRRRRFRHRDAFRRPPEPFERIERARLGAEDVDDEVEVVEQDPSGAVAAFDVRGLDALSPSESWIASEMA